MELNGPQNVISTESDDSSDYISKPQKQCLLKQASYSLQDIYCHIETLIKKECLRQMLVSGEVINFRYQVRRIIGRGAFGKVVEAWDLQNSEKVAIKFIKQKPGLEKHVHREIKTLEKLNKVDIEKGYIVRMLDCFEWNEFLCIVLEQLSVNLFQVLRSTNFKGLPLEEIRDFAWQLCMALRMFSFSSLQIVHCDLKPENIMLKDPNHLGIKVVDFGSACKAGKPFFRYVQSRYYRAPEVLLELPYSAPIDMWSLGCILVELHTGTPLFCGENQEDQLLKIMKVLGPLPESMLKTKKIHSEEPPCGLHYLLKDFRTQDSQTYDTFLDLVSKMLIYNPSERITPLEALKHRFFTDQHFPKIIRPSKTLPNTKRPGSLNTQTKSEVPWPKHKFAKGPQKKVSCKVSPNLNNLLKKGFTSDSPFSKQSTQESRNGSLFQSPWGPASQESDQTHDSTTPM